MKTGAGAEQAFASGQGFSGEEVGGLLAVNSLGAAAVLDEIDTSQPASPNHRPAITIKETVDLDYLAKTGLVKRQGDGSVSA